MRIERRIDDAAIHYRLTVEDGDDPRGESMLRRPDRRVALRSRTWRVLRDPLVLGEGPGGERHPDLEAAALFLVVHPFVGPRLTLPFAVSERYAGVVREEFGVEVGPIDPSLSPREAPSQYPPTLIFSGGADSTATSLILPDETFHLFLDRTPHLPPEGGTAALVDLVQQRTLCHLLRRDGRTVHIHEDDHEILFEPYPFPHTNMSVLPALYRADALGLRFLDMGAVMADQYLQGYLIGARKAWRFQPEDRRPEMAWRDAAELPPPPARGDTEEREGIGLDRHLQAVGLQMAKSAVGLSEVATSLIVHRSPYRGKSYSCFQKSFHNFCMRCDKCFRKLLLSHVFRDIDVPDALVDTFLAVPRLTRLLREPYLDFHQVWTYVFQRVRSRHPVITALQRQAQQAPDLAVLEKWYPPSRRHSPLAYRAAIEQNVRKYLDVMDEADIACIEALELPPFRAPDGDGAVGAGGAA